MLIHSQLEIQSPRVIAAYQYELVLATISTDSGLVNFGCLSLTNIFGTKT